MNVLVRAQALSRFKLNCSQALQRSPLQWCFLFFLSLIYFIHMEINSDQFNTVKQNAEAEYEKIRKVYW
jgi:hypothetical protein